MDVAICLIIHGTCMNVLFAIKENTMFLINDNKVLAPPLNHVDCNG